ncbi:DUF2867 domain-containing protein [Luteipulveratus halotolerans]|uniref:DUF2867 domain-containing protein n=1 Tax=Luteipulveratus halotolerans TaxID=1631356 RepID=A0A0L6CK70_9MICO|nr:DUF2867 domain-containing protein [Luteipulveratus halotolerans]KNX37918.1 hypothetical protein VV01_13365 [Luteipulveratus halotolerans]
MSTATADVRTGTRLPKAAHREQPWRIHELTPDFELEDVWSLPTPGGPDDFPLLLQMNSGADAYNHPSLVVRTMMNLRWRLGALLGWDGDADGVGQRVPSMRDRLPQDLRDGPRGHESKNGLFQPLYLTDTEFADEYANKTVHLVGHISWVRTPDGGYRGQMAMLVKPNGRFGSLYMKAIKPFRYYLVYPALMRSMAGDWRRLKAEQIGAAA